MASAIQEVFGRRSNCPTTAFVNLGRGERWSDGTAFTSADGVRARAAGLLERVEPVPPDAFLDKFRHQLSGGQRQRVFTRSALSIERRHFTCGVPGSSRVCVM